jgi:hypothetical protein
MNAREQIARSAPASLAGCAAKLRVLLHHEIGIETHALSEDDLASLRQILAFVEREVLKSNAEDEAQP